MRSLFRSFNQDNLDLVKSLLRGGIYKHIFLEYDGFLPSWALSPWKSLLDICDEDTPLRVDDLYLPTEVELVVDSGRFLLMSNDGRVGEVFLQGDSADRIIKFVEYYDTDGSILYRNNYCSNGFIFRKDFYVGGRLFTSCYYDCEGSLVVRHDIPTDFLLAEGVLLYSSLSEFYLDYLTKYLATNSTLFTGEVLGLGVVDGLDNKVFLLTESSLSNDKEYLSLIKTTKTLVTNRSLYEIIRYRYPKTKFYQLLFEKVSDIGSPNHAIITTDTDNIVFLEELANSCKNTIFHVYATTQVSPKLADLGTKENIEVVPTASLEEVGLAFRNYGIFLDLSTGLEVYNSNRRAVECSLLRIGVVGVSSGKYIAKELMFYSKDFKGIANILNLVSNNNEKLEDLVSSQNMVLGYGYT